MYSIYLAVSIGFTKNYFSIDENVPCIGICEHNRQKCYLDKHCVDYDKGIVLKILKKKCNFGEICP